MIEKRREEMKAERGGEEREREREREDKRKGVPMKSIIVILVCIVTILMYVDSVMYVALLE